MAETSQFIIKYLADTKTFTNSLKDLNRINKETAKKLGSDFTKATKIISTNIDRINSKKVKVDGKDTIKNFTQISTVFKDVNGNLKTMTQQGELTKNGFKTLNTTIKDGGKTTRTFADNIKTLGLRALTTIPIWFALRNAIFGTFRGIKEGITNIIEFDRALQKLKKNLQGTPEEIEKNFNRATEVITKFAIESGRSTEEIARAIQQFATVGFDFATSLEAGIGATKLAVQLFGEGEETAKAFGRAMNVLVDRSDALRTPGQQINEIFALTSELWETNAFEIGELSQGLEKFAGTAKALNLTAEETVTILSALSTQGLNANRGGTLLRTTFQKLEGNLSSVASVLGVKVNPEVDRTFDVFRKVTNAIAELKSEAGTVSPKVSEAIREIFGGVRGGEPILDIIADIEKVNGTLDKFTKKSGDIKKFNQSFDDVSASLFRQNERFINLRKEMGKAFATGITGADDANESFKKLNDTIEPMINGIGAIGKGFNFSLKTATLFANVVKNFAGLQPKFEGNGLVESLTEQSEIFDRIKETFDGQSTVVEIGELIADIQEINTKFPDDVVDGQTIAVLRRAYSENVTTALENETITIKPEIKIDSPNITQNVDTNDLLKATLADQQAISKVIVDNELQRLKLAGALESELLKTETALNKQFNIAESELDVLKRQLDTEREINEEKRLRNSLSSETVKLFRIAQESGVGVARQIGDVLSGNIDFSQFIQRGGEAVEIFKDQFSGLFEQQQASAFFEGRRQEGVNTLSGGAGISIAESNIRSGVPAFSASAQNARNRAISSVPNIRQELFTTVQLNANITGLSVQEALGQLSTEFAKQLLDPSSDIARAFNEKLNNF